MKVNVGYHSSLATLEELKALVERSKQLLCELAEVYAKYNMVSVEEMLAVAPRCCCQGK